MFQIKPMTAQDYRFAADLANTMDWNMAPEDFAFMAALEPEGCLVAYDGTERVGVATCIGYGRLGWFGNLIVEKSYRKKGVGSLLVKHAIRLLQFRGVETVGLYAYPNLAGFYSSLGFKLDADFSVLVAGNLNLTAKTEMVRSVGKDKLENIELFDQQCFGGDRKKLLDSIILDKGNMCCYASDSGKVVGYVAATVYESMAWLGPLMCQNGKFDTAISLSKRVLAHLGGKKVYTVIPKENSPLHEFFLALGFREDFFVSRMFLGKVAAKNCIYLAESLERG